MTDQKISLDPNLATPDVADVVPIIDVSEPVATANKTITWQQILSTGGWANMSEAVWTGGTQSEVADGATAVAFGFDTDAAYSTAGSKLASWSNGGTEKIAISYAGGLSVNSGATTAAHAQSVNLNFSASGANTSSGQYSCVIGVSNRASGSQSVAVGTANNSFGNSSVAIGDQCVASANNAIALGYKTTISGVSSAGVGHEGSTSNEVTFIIGGKAFSVIGDCQASTSVLKAATTNATQTTMTARATNLVIPADTTWAFSALIAARSDEADGNEQSVWEIKGCLGRDELDNTVLVGTPIISQLAASANAISDGWAVVAEADDVNEALAIKVTGAAATNIRWVAKVDISQVTFA